jgi:hypothetical protein
MSPPNPWRQSLTPHEQIRGLRMVYELRYQCFSQARFEPIPWTLSGMAGGEYPASAWRPSPAP